ncbi:MAG: alanine/ornithine racemase family PLP-dependent enzyme [Cryomorphaceae bacterium]|nr:MAG: alanine/ornithine racemase family PLP-dependent enzyme [Cryomorphaceae bacterium]
MAFIRLYTDKLKHNYEFLQRLFHKRNIDWGVVSKILCGNELFIQELLKLGIREIHDSRVSNLKLIKKLNPQVQTVYIKPPARRSIPSIVRFADVSFNSELDTIRMLSAEAKKQNKTHKIIIMIEMGDLREGVLGEELLDFYGEVFNLPHIEVSGIGTNLNCLHGVMPSQDKLIQLSLYKQLIEAKFNVKIPWVSGGTSVTVPLLLRNMRPMAVNHFRVGEVLFFGNNLFTNKFIKGMKTDVFKLYAEVIELTEKPMVPIGELGQNVAGHAFEVEEENIGKTHFRAIVDIGLLDVQTEYLVPEDKHLVIAEASSDMLVLDLGKTRRNYKVGDLISFRLQYMAVLRLMNSDYIEKQVQ